MSKHLTILLLLAIVALGAFFRFYQITEIPPGLYPDEAMNGNNALEAIATGEFRVFYPENNGREGLFINLQALSLWTFGNEPWVLRVVSAFFGTLTILGLYIVTKELFQDKISKFESLISKQSQNPNDKNGFRDSRLEIRDSYGKYIALLSTFFLAVSFWHINFSRIGFRAILVPFFATLGMYFLLKGLRRGKILDLVLAGIFVGLGFYTYIGYRFIPFVFAVPIAWYIWQYIKTQNAKRKTQNNNSKLKTCIPCAVLLFLFVTFVVALPMGYYFIQNPQDFVGRAGDVSIFSAESPLKELIKSNITTLGMFFVLGDCNWRHNFACWPQLNPIVAAFFIIGFGMIVRGLFHKPSTLYTLHSTLLIAWLFFMSLPATLTKEGLPHALRAIGMIPPVMILAGFGAWLIYQKTIEWFEKQKVPRLPEAATGMAVSEGDLAKKRPTYLGQLERIKKEILLLFILILALMPIITYRQYFVRWANDTNTYFAFSTDIWHLGQFLNNLPQETKKYVVVNLPGVDIRGIPAPAQTVMFATDTFREERRQERNITYINSYRDETSIVATIEVSPRQKTVIAFLNGGDRALINAMKNKFPELKVKVPGDFVILQNY